MARIAGPPRARGWRSDRRPSTGSAPRRPPTLTDPPAGGQSGRPGHRLLRTGEAGRTALENTGRVAEDSCMVTALHERLVAALPQGRHLPQEVWDRRHRAVLRAAAAQAGGPGALAPLPGPAPLVPPPLAPPGPPPPGFPALPRA